jgi:hypothetical protein
VSHPPVPVPPDSVNLVTAPSAGFGAARQHVTEEVRPTPWSSDDEQEACQTATIQPSGGPFPANIASESISKAREPRGRISA